VERANMAKGFNARTKNQPDHGGLSLASSDQFTSTTTC
jgi:hypothetical protein